MRRKVIPEEELRRLYVEERLSSTQIAEQFDCSSKLVMDRLKEAKIVTRSPREGRSVRCEDRRNKRNRSQEGMDRAEARIGREEVDLLRSVGVPAYHVEVWSRVDQRPSISGLEGAELRFRVMEVTNPLVPVKHRQKLEGNNVSWLNGRKLYLDGAGQPRPECFQSPGQPPRDKSLHLFTALDIPFSSEQLEDYYFEDADLLFLVSTTVFRRVRRLEGVRKQAFVESVRKMAANVVESVYQRNPL